jgi:hypothetical protein
VAKVDKDSSITVLSAVDGRTTCYARGGVGSTGYLHRGEAGKLPSRVTTNKQGGNGQRSASVEAMWRESDLTGEWWRQDSECPGSGVVLFFDARRPWTVLDGDGGGW